MASIEGASRLKEIATANLQSVVDFGIHLLPEKFQEGVSLAATNTLHFLLTEIFGIALGTGASWDGTGIVLNQIIGKIDQLQKDVDILLHVPMEDAKESLEKAFNYLQHENYKKAQEEFCRVLEKSSTAFHSVKSFENKVFCKQLAIFSRLMKDTFDEEKETFLSLSSVPVNLYNAITDNIFHDLKQVIAAFDKLEIPMMKTILGQGAAEKCKNQDILDSLLKVCLPMIWHRFEIFRENHKNQKMLKFVPEGQNDAAMIRFDDKTNIMIWKEIDSRDQKFCLKWDEENSVSTYDRKEFFKLFYGIQKSCLFPFKSLITETCSPLREGLFEEKCEIFCQEIKEKFNINFTKKNNIVKARYKGQFDDKSKQEIEEWVNLPPWIKLFGRDESYNTLAHSVCKKGFTDLIPHFLTEENSKFQNSFYSTPLHRAVKSNDLKCVEKTIECGGLVQLQDAWYYYPWDYATKNEEIKEYLNSFLVRPKKISVENLKIE